MRCLLRFGGGRGGRLDGGVEVDDGDTTVGGEAGVVFVDACLSCLMRCLDLNLRPIDLLFRYIGIITSQ